MKTSTQVKHSVKTYKLGIHSALCQGLTVLWLIVVVVGERRDLVYIKLPAFRNEAYKIWHENWLSELTKYRVVDAEFKALIENGSVYTCEKHFKPKEIETCKLFIFVYLS